MQAAKRANLFDQAENLLVHWSIVSMIGTMLQWLQKRVDTTKNPDLDGGIENSRVG